MSHHNFKLSFEKLKIAQQDSKLRKTTPNPFPLFHIYSEIPFRLFSLIPNTCTAGAAAATVSVVHCLSLYTFLPVLVPKQLKQTFVVVYHAAAGRFAVIPHSLSPLFLQRQRDRHRQRNAAKSREESGQEKLREARRRVMASCALSPCLLDCQHMIP